MKTFWIALKLFLCLSLITGILYPLLITGIAQLVFNHKANGSILYRNDTPVGSKLIGQKFEGDRHFWGRPSAHDYNPLPSGGSNLGPTSARLKQAVKERQTKIMEAHEINDPDEIPSELLFASGSGLDPYISPETAYFQIDRIVKARNFQDKKQLEELIKNLIKQRRFGFLGVPCVNVLELNLSLEQLSASDQNE
jgi:K+-transporting ATPase ATPase C chain